MSFEPGHAVQILAKLKIFFNRVAEQLRGMAQITDQPADLHAVELRYFQTVDLQAAGVGQLPKNNRPNVDFPQARGPVIPMICPA